MILETKLQPPSLKPNTLRRERLLKLLKNNLERRLVLITGDAGYGKTTLLAQVMKEEDFPCVYYDLDRGDSDLVVFCSYLVHGLEKLKKGLALRTKGLLEQGGEVGKNYELLFGTLINELVEKRKEELFFLLDDFHALPEESLVHQAVDYFIDHLPDIVHVVIASRTIPPLPSLSKWRAKEDLFELTREGLRFTEEEVKALLSEVYKLVLTEEEIKRVSEQTEGWITGIKLILQSAGKDGKTIKETLNGYLEANQPLFEYFANEIVASEALGVQDFLRKSSILDVMTPEACDKIFHLEGSEELLKGLEKRNLFFSQVGKGEYKYHHLFREYLLSQIKDEAFKKALHLRAADYYQRKEQWEQAIEHYLEAGSYEWAARIIIRSREWWERSARFATLEGYLKQIPEEVFDGTLELLVLRGTLRVHFGRLKEAEADLCRAAEQLRVGNRLSLKVRALDTLGMTFRYRRAYPQALAAVRKALLLTKGSRDLERISALNSVACIWSELNNLPRAKKHFLQAKRMAEAHPDYQEALVVTESNLAGLLLQEGEVREGWTSFQRWIGRFGKRYRYGIGMPFLNASRAALISTPRLPRRVESSFL